MIRNQLCKQPKHADRFDIFELGRLGVDGTKRAEKSTVRQDDRNGYVTLKAVDARRVVVRISRILRDIVDHYLAVVSANLIAESRLDFQFSASRQTKVDIVKDLAGYPAVFCNPGNRGKSHPGRFADNFQYRRYRRDTSDCVDVGLEIGFHFVLLRSARTRLKVFDPFVEVRWGRTIRASATCEPEQCINARDPSTRPISTAKAS